MNFLEVPENDSMTCGVNDFRNLNVNMFLKDSHSKSREAKSCWYKLLFISPL